MKNIRVTNFGQIKEADISFGDFTLFVGPQATGKSILLQLIKLLLDRKKILTTILANGFDLQDKNNFRQIYFGEGIINIWNKKTEIFIDQNKINLEELINQKKLIGEFELVNDFVIDESLFFIPAQRVITLADGWPRSFSSFEDGTFVVRDFSENLRTMMRKDELFSLKVDHSIFPNSEHLAKELYEEINKTIFHGASISLKITGMRKKIHLDIEGNSLPFMAFSAGQREFIPLLLSFYWLTHIKSEIPKMEKKIPIEFNRETEIIGQIFNAMQTKYNSLKWVVIEEPEMGLHPQAILSVILMCLELLNQGYKLIISTHSPVLLEAVWVIRFLQTENPDIKYLYQLFNLEASESMTALFENILKNKTFSTYYFDQQKDGVYVKDISTLDPGDLDSAIADWGGLTSFSSRASEVVSQAFQEKA
jgi:energy-coupling factor transporter ATP-binding protein EcfA2